VRLLVAVDLDVAARAAAAGSTHALASGIATAGAPVPVRWVQPEQLHFTLRFLEEVSEGQAESVRRALSIPWKTGAFSASLAGLDLFPFSGALRVIWLGMQEGREQMSALKHELEHRLVSVGFESDTRQFRVHLMLVRLNRTGALSACGLRTIFSRHRPETARWVVDHVTLYESRMSYRRTTHHVVESTMLAAS
jgi:2'-5' RNA ligase